MPSFTITDENELDKVASSFVNTIYTTKYFFYGEVVRENNLIKKFNIRKLKTMSLVQLFLL